LYGVINGKKHLVGVVVPFRNTIGCPSMIQPSRRRMKLFSWISRFASGLMTTRVPFLFFFSQLSDDDLQIPLQRVKNEVDVPTILYMPHCEVMLYESVLRDNWNKERLANIVFIGNRLSNYVDG
jgi:hypothetical protein